MPTSLSYQSVITAQTLLPFKLSAAFLYPPETCSPPHSSIPSPASPHSESEQHPSHQFGRGLMSTVISLASLLPGNVMTMVRWLPRLQMVSSEASTCRTRSSSSEMTSTAWILASPLTMAESWQYTCRVQLSLDLRYVIFHSPSRTVEGTGPT